MMLIQYPTSINGTARVSRLSWSSSHPHLRLLRSTALAFVCLVITVGVPLQASAGTHPVYYVSFDEQSKRVICAGDRGNICIVDVIEKKVACKAVLPTGNNVHLVSFWGKDQVLIVGPTKDLCFWDDMLNKECEKVPSP